MIDNIVIIVFFIGIVVFVGAAKLVDFARDAVALNR